MARQATAITDSPSEVFIPMPPFRVLVIGVWSLAELFTMQFVNHPGLVHFPIDIIATMTGPQAVSRMFPTA